MNCIIDIFSEKDKSVTLRNVFCYPVLLLIVDNKQRLSEELVQLNDQGYTNTVSKKVYLQALTASLEAIQEEYVSLRGNKRKT